MQIELIKSIRTRDLGCFKLVILHEAWTISYINIGHGYKESGDGQGNPVAILT